MNYIAVDWLHANPTEPIVLYSELGDDNTEIRKVEVFADGSAGFATATTQKGGTKLAIEPLPSIGEIGKDQQFLPRAISAEEFDRIWDKYVGQT
jgi:hypothetical protein